MSTKIFCTGVTGYIGGDWLFAANEAHEDWEITCLVRNSSKGAKVVSQYPRVRLIYGDLDATDLITEEAQKADIVYHFANCDHEASAQAILRGLALRSEPSFYIHTSGTLILGWETMEKGCYGELLPKVFNDWDGVNELVSQPDWAAHRAVDKIVLAGGSSLIHTAIVCPPTIYGPGRGPDNQVSQQAYGATRIMLENQIAFTPTKAENKWHYVHIQDLSDLYVLLGEAAASGGGNATWGSETGYYLAENGDFVWGDIFRSIAKTAYNEKLLPSAETKILSSEEVNKFKKYGTYMWATNSRGESIRGKKLLGWKPHRQSLMEEIADIVKGEAKSLGLIKGHAAKVEE